MNWAASCFNPTRRQVADPQIAIHEDAPDARVLRATKVSRATPPVGVAT